jgi:hypothetical protein
MVIVRWMTLIRENGEEQRSDESKDWGLEETSEEQSGAVVCDVQELAKRNLRKMIVLEYHQQHHHRRFVSSVFQCLNEKGPQETGKVADLSAGYGHRTSNEQ